MAGMNIRPALLSPPIIVEADMKLSSYKKSDKVQIKGLFENVFSQSEGQAEGALVANLVLDLINSTRDQDIFGFIARENDQVIGSIFFTRLHFDTPVEAFILAPVAVHPDYQGKGIGQKLIRYGIGQLRENGVELAFTYGDPDFYSKVGFRPIAEDLVRAPLELSQPEGWLAQSLDGSEIVPLAGKPRCVAALNKPEYW
jgi:putative acetyltransferase